MGEPADCNEGGEKVGWEPCRLRKVLQEVPEPKCSTKDGPPDQVPLVPPPQWVTVSEQRVDAAPLNQSLSAKPLFTSALRRRKCETFSRLPRSHTLYIPFL